MKRKIDIPEKYDKVKWTSKLWQGNIVYWEPVTFVTDIDGNMPTLKLLYKPEKILAVRRADGFVPAYEGRDYKYDKRKDIFFLDDTIELKEGRDYELTGKGEITLLTKTRIVPTTYDELHFFYKEDQPHDWLQMPSDHRRYFNLYNTLYKSRIYVTYTHKDTWGDSYVPKDETSNLPRLTGMFKAKKPVNFTIFGDSIATGADGSGPDELVIDVSNCQEVRYKVQNAPFTPSWAEMVTSTLRDVYGYDEIFKINRAAGASASAWGVAHADELVNPKKPDVLVLAFGMNESSCPKEDYKERINKIIDIIHEKNPECEFILLSSMEPNPELGHTTLGDFEKAHYEIQKERPDLHIAVCPLNSFFWAVIGRGKRFTDISSTNFNHPNDFLIRMYAQAMLATLGI